MLAPNNPEEEIKLQQYVKAHNLQYGEDAMENLRHGWMAKAAEMKELMSKLKFFVNRYQGHGESYFGVGVRIEYMHPYASEKTVQDIVDRLNANKGLP